MNFREKSNSRTFVVNAMAPPRCVRKQPTATAAAAQAPVCIAKESKPSKNQRRKQTEKAEQRKKVPSAVATPRTPKATVATPKTEKMASVKLLEENAAKLKVCTPSVMPKIETPSGKKASSKVQKLLRGDTAEIKGAAGRKSTQTTPRVKADLKKDWKKSMPKGPYTNTRSKAKMSN